jgi:hypothetical protein
MLLLNDELVVLRVFVFFGRRQQDRAVVLPRKGLTLDVVLELFRIWRALVASSDGELSVQAGASGARLVVGFGGTETETVAKAAGAVFSFLGLILLGRWGVRGPTVLDAVFSRYGLRIRGGDVAEMGAQLLNWLVRGSTFAGRAANGGRLILGWRDLLGLGRRRQVSRSINGGRVLEAPRI